MNEFLEVHDGLTRANYYIPLALPGIREYLLPARRRWHSKRLTDQILLNFGADYPGIVEYGSLAVSEAINGRSLKAFDIAFQHLPKDRRKILLARASFLIERRFICVPLSRAACARAQDLLAMFTQKYQMKRNFRNSMSDLLILATALEARRPLLTKDSLLARFAADVSEATSKTAGRFVELNFARANLLERKPSRASKGYVNRSWAVHFRKVGYRHP